MGLLIERDAVLSLAGGLVGEFTERPINAACEPHNNCERRPGAPPDFAGSAPALAPAAAPLMHAAQHRAGAARLAKLGIR